jgi:chloramphenicol 3-O-phosphotransferase
MKGPFYQLESRVGIPNDDFYRISEQDVLDAANSLPPQILIIGKPRSGKTTIAADLAAKLGIKHINVDNWITALLEKIKNYEAPDLDPEDENAEPPKWLTDVEEAVNEQLKNG